MTQDEKLQEFEELHEESFEFSERLAELKDLIEGTENEYILTYYNRIKHDLTMFMIEVSEAIEKLEE